MSKFRLSDKKYCDRIGQKKRRRSAAVDGRNNILSNKLLSNKGKCVFLENKTIIEVKFKKIFKKRELFLNFYV